MTFALLVGVCLAASAALAPMALRRVPRRTRCPECGRRTDAVLPPPWLRPGQRWLSMRWCAFCSWEGIGRRGPEIVPGRKVAHDSGFHWGAEETEPDGGFQWAAAPEPVPTPEPPHHPSGFRFGAAPEGQATQHSHASGFSWAPRAERGAAKVETAHRSGFAWRRRPEKAPVAPPREPEEKPEFRWGDAARPKRTFRWKGEA